MKHAHSRTRIAVSGYGDGTGHELIAFRGAGSGQSETGAGTMRLAKTQKEHVILEIDDQPLRALRP